MDPGTGAPVWRVCGVGEYALRMICTGVAGPLKCGIRFHKRIGQVAMNYTQKRPDRNNLQGDL